MSLGYVFVCKYACTRVYLPACRGQRSPLNFSVTILFCETRTLPFTQNTAILLGLLASEPQQESPLLFASPALGLQEHTNTLGFFMWVFGDPSSGPPCLLSTSSARKNCFKVTIPCSVCKVFTGRVLLQREAETLLPYCCRDSL